jgi:hypothetical protein
MFESNFPQEKPSCSYGVFWNACKRASAALGDDERHDLFVGTACRAYNLDLGDLDVDDHDHGGAGVPSGQERATS